MRFQRKRIFRSWRAIRQNGESCDRVECPERAKRVEGPCSWRGIRHKPAFQDAFNGFQTMTSSSVCGSSASCAAQTGRYTLAKRMMLSSEWPITTEVGDPFIPPSIARWNSCTRSSTKVDPSFSSERGSSKGGVEQRRRRSSQVTFVRFRSLDVDRVHGGVIVRRATIEQLRSADPRKFDACARARNVCFRSVRMINLSCPTETCVSDGR